MFLILTVLYNKTIAKSATLQGIIQSAVLLNDSGSKLLLWDNSVQRMNNKDLSYLSSVLNNFEYVHTPQNHSLSRIYNKGIEKGLNKGEFKYLMLLDDDSTIDLNYFDKAVKGAKGNYFLMIPVVKNNGIIRSPMISYTIRTSILSKVYPGLTSSKNMMAINSGMIISFDFLKSTKFTYERRLNNYGTDNYFMKFYGLHCKTFYILDYSFEHSLSFFDSIDIDKKIQIFRQSKKAFLIIHSDNLFNLMMALGYNFMSSLKNSVKYKTLKFFK